MADSPFGMGYWGTGGTAAAAAPAAAPAAKGGNQAGLVNRMDDLARQIEDEERRRYQGGLGTLTEAYNTSKSAMNDLVDPDLLFSKASDAVGARSKRALEGLRSSFGARGLRPGSGVGQGALSRLAFETEGALTGAKRDIALQNQQQRLLNAATNFANAYNLANYQNAPVGGARLETAQNIFEGNLTERAIAAQRGASRDAANATRDAAWIGFGGNILGSLIPGL